MNNIKILENFNFSHQLIGVAKDGSLKLVNKSFLNRVWMFLTGKLSGIDFSAESVVKKIQEVSKTLNESAKKVKIAENLEKFAMKLQRVDIAKYNAVIIDINEVVKEIRTVQPAKQPVKIEVGYSPEMARKKLGKVFSEEEIRALNQIPGFEQKPLESFVKDIETKGVDYLKKILERHFEKQEYERNEILENRELAQEIARRNSL